ncbi:MAG: LysR family transcriptional regulator [Bdellovibrio sp.]
MILPNLNHLKYFLDAVDCGSISEAADKNLVTHPAVSRAIKALEEQLNVKLLVHKKKSFEVTKAGLAMAEKARLLLDTAKKFNDARMATDVEPSGTVAIAISRTIGQAYLSSILNEVERKFPKVKIHIRFGTTAEIVQMVTKGSVDFGISIGQQKMVTLKQTLLKKGEFVLVSAATKKFNSSKEISSAAFIVTEPKFETEILKKEFYRKYKIPIHIKHEVASWDMIASLVAKGHGIGLVPDISLMSIQKTNLHQVKSDWFECSYEIYIHQPKIPKNRTVKAIAEVIENYVFA